MYTGTLIKDLMAAAERVGQKSEQQLAEELHEIFTMQISTDSEQAFMGAA